MTTNNDLLVTAEQVAEIKSVLTRKTSSIKRAGNLEAFAFMESQARLGKLLAFKEIKDSGEYKGVPYTDENGEQQTTQNIKEFCKYLIGESVSSLNEELQNIEVLGQSFFDKTKQLKISQKELRLLRKQPEDKRIAIIEKINNEEIDLNDPEAVKELLEDEAVKHSREVNDLKNQVREAEQTVKAVRANSDDKTQQLDELKEHEAKRRFSQDPWKATVLDHAKGMLEARVLIEKGINQLSDIFSSFKEQEATLDEKGVNLIARSLMTETTCTNQLVDEFCSNVFGLLGGLVQDDLDAGEIYQELELGINTETTTQDDTKQ